MLWLRFVVLSGFGLYFSRFGLALLSASAVLLADAVVLPVQLECWNVRAAMRTVVQTNHYFTRGNCKCRPEFLNSSIRDLISPEACLLTCALARRRIRANALPTIGTWRNYLQVRRSING